ncbi:odorant receptor 63a-like [Vespa mandarinia]|uniref:odorant receptor 63a-like n=1 Tax=Vespa mandarinia TaxID=7446 RepID=UPI001621BC87|nr:odorant receptor 63a-like [Vespa mandarinia]
MYPEERCISAGEETKLIAFVIIAGCVLSTLMAYCYIGECLINESTSFGESFYQCKWYNISQEEIKLMHICMMRSSKQMQLTVGKFFALSLTTFTDVVKTSMAYLSELDFHGTRRLIDLNKRTLNCAGIWPEKIHEPVFIFFSVYLALHCTMGVISITNNISNLEYVLACFEENLFHFMTLLKICICRINSNSLAEIIKEIKVDFIPERYKTDEEKIAFLNYNNFSLMVVRVTLGTSSTAAVLIVLLLTVVANSSYGYVLPYKSRPLIEPTNLTIYICLCLYQFLIVLTIIFGYIGSDCLFINLVLHVSGVFSALSCKVKHVLNNPENRKRRIKKLILRHIRLVRLADSLESNFNVLILQELMGITLHLSLLGYDTLVCIAAGEQKKLITFFIVACRVLSTLLLYCYIGECLINESTSFGESFYQCKWYNISQEEIKLIHICMMRSSKQMELTVGKFFVLSLTTFTDVVKTSMAYLSVLRTFM